MLMPKIVILMRHEGKIETVRISSAYV